MRRARLAVWFVLAACWGIVFLWRPLHSWPWAVLLGGLTGALWVVEATAPGRGARPPRAAQGPPAASVEVTLAAAEALHPSATLTGAGLAEAAQHWTGPPYPLPPPVPDMASAPYPGHDHGPAAGPCDACLATLRMLAGLAGATVETGATRVATPAEVTDAQAAAGARAIMAGHDAEAANYRARSAEQAAAMLRELGAPFESGPPCAAVLGEHLCRNRPGFAQECATHKCACGTVWGATSALGTEYPYPGKPLPPSGGQGKQERELPS
jgi:hypothetical protein